VSTKKTQITVSFILFVVVLTSAVSGQSKTSGSRPFPGARIIRDSAALHTIEKSIHTRLETALSTFLDIYSESSGWQSAVEFARHHHIKLKEDHVLVELILKDNRSVEEITESMLKKCNAEVDCRSKHFILLWVPIEQLGNVAESIGFISLVHRPFEPREDIVSEGIESIGAEEFHNNDILGQGAKIAVIDIGFAILEDAQESGELPRELTVQNYSDEPIDEGSFHGVGCAEIVYDLAPEAELYLLKTQYSPHFEDAINYSSEEGIHIISRSLSQWVPLGDYYRGEDWHSEIVNEVNQNGILFVSSAGNSARRHYRAEFDDQDEMDDYHRFADDVSVNQFIAEDGEYINIEPESIIQASLVWDDFPLTDQNYDLYLVHWDDDREEWEVADESTFPQDGDAPPWEYLAYWVQEEGYYGIMVHNNDGDDGIDFTLNTRTDISFYTTEGSIDVPALAEGTFAVGAIADSVWNDEEIEIEYYSSQGPTYDGRLKPELCGPSAVSTLAYGDRSFRGTSASCPHAAGAAALLLSQNNDRTNEDLRALLLSYAFDVGDEGPDNVFGFGKLNLIECHIIDVPEDYETIQEAIDAAEDGDTVLVHPGTYIENIDFIGKDIVVGSLFLTTENAVYVDSTIIDGDSNGGSVVTFNNEETEVAELVGFTIQNGAVDESGGGIYILGSRPTISNCVIFANSADHKGGGIIVSQDCSPIIKGCTIVGNYAGDIGGGIAVEQHASPVISYCMFAGNFSDIHGWYLSVVEDCSLVLINCTMSWLPIFGWTYALFCSASDLTIVNSIIYGDSPLSISFDPNNAASSITVAYSNIYGGRNSIYTNDNDEVNWLDGNIADDPRFVDYHGGDYHLTEGSPCIDAGTAFFVWEDDTLVNMSEEEYNGEASDMGAYESVYSRAGANNSGMPTEFRLYQNYPNPFNSTATITYGLPYQSHVSLQIYNPLGQWIGTLFEGYQHPGIHTSILTANNLPSGLYFVRLETSGLSLSNKIMLVK